LRPFAAVVEWDPEAQLYVGSVPGLPGAHTQAARLDELQCNLKEVVEPCLEEFRSDIEELPRFVGIQQVEIAV
jgi:predicted RNase H-like HicB family nuclease